MEPLVSIIMPTYNHERFIREAIDSALNQTYSNIELIISDDASTDKTPEIMRSYRDPRIKTHFFPDNKGLAYNHGRCLDMASGKYCCYLATDDYWAPTKIEQQVKMLEENPELGGVFTLTEIVDERSQIVPNEILQSPFMHHNRSRSEWLSHMFFEGNPLCAASAMIPTEIYKRIANVDIMAPFKMLPDFYGWRMLLLEREIHVIQDVLTFMRCRDDNGNLSTAADVKGVMVLNKEYYYWLNDFFDGMDDSLFIETFSKFFINPDGIYSKERLDCEKALLLLRTPLALSIGRIASCGKLFELMKDEKYRTILRQEYYFGIQDFHELKTTFYQAAVEGKPFSEKFKKVLNLLEDEKNKVAIFGLDKEHSYLLMDYLTENGSVSKVKCMVEQQYDGVPTAALQDAINVLGINTLVIASYFNQNSLYKGLESLKNYGVNVVRLYSTTEVLTDFYEAR